MRQPLAKVGVAFLVGTLLAVVAGVGPASAVNVRYRATDSCTVNGKTFRADIHTYGKPTPAGAPAYTEVQLWGYYFESGAGPEHVEAVKMVWRDGNWQWAGPLGYVTNPANDGEWHNGPRVGVASQEIGYITPTMPTAILVRGWLNAFDYCHVILRPYDLYWIG